MNQYETNIKGSVAELAIATAAAKLGLPVFQPMTEHGRYDLVFEVGRQLMRVQCKWAVRRGDIVEVRFVTNRRGPDGFIRTRYTADEIDAVAAYCADTDACYLMPMSLVGERSSMYLRLRPPKNGQRACINLASDYELAGAVAQMEERSDGIRKVRGSNPLSSTSTVGPAPSGHTVGANKFRNHFGLYMERAAAGEEFLVTRRGRPTVRLSPADLRLLAAD